MSRIELGAGLAEQLARTVIANATREFPSKLDHIMAAADDVQSPRALHPVFYGSFDWHSCVHGYWLLARLLQRYPDLLEGAAAEALVREHFTADKIAIEVSYIKRPWSGSFERPYGLAWVLKLANELSLHNTAFGTQWLNALVPLARECATRLNNYFLTINYPIRAGNHYNSAFALVFAMEYADRRRDLEMSSTLRRRCLEWFGGDKDCQGWEPDGEDFLSPALIEAVCMSTVLTSDDFTRWLGEFLPDISSGKPAALFQPAAVKDRTDAKLVHLDGLNLSRSWCWRLIAKRLDDEDDRRAIALDAAAAHLQASLPHIADNYSGGHWLGTFAALAIDP